MDTEAIRSSSEATTDPLDPAEAETRLCSVRGALVGDFCPVCNTRMRPETSHHRCDGCGYRTSCCA